MTQLIHSFTHNSNHVEVYVYVEAGVFGYRVNDLNLLLVPLNDENALRHFTADGGAWSEIFDAIHRYQNAHPEPEDYVLNKAKGKSNG